MHAFNQRILAEDLVRVRRPDDGERYAAAQRQARIDPNPHQIDAVIFALRRLREGGCILADEVGLGKTIEAGLVIAQSRAEGAQRILLIVPKSLIGQWQGELINLFGIEAHENEASFFALVDGKGAPALPCPVRCIVDGDALTMVLYVDGALAASAATTRPISPGSPALYVGRWVGSGRLLVGDVDDVVVYDRALVAGEIAELVQVSPPDPD